MEQSRSSFKFGKISFQRSRSVPNQTNDRMQRLDESRSGTERSKSKSQLSKCYPLNIPDSPQQAMEFLSRSWSPSSSNFFQILSTNSLATSSENSETEENREELDSLETEKSLVQYNRNSTNQLDQLLVELSGLKYRTSDDQNHKTIHTSWVHITSMKQWLREELFSFPGLSKSSRKKKRESLRFHEAQVHAALCVARLASAVASTVATSNVQESHRILSKNRSLCLTNERNNSVKDQLNQNSVLASAAALVATICAEAAESVGAKRKEVISAIRMGLEANGSADLLTLTATAATSLRGAAALKQRSESNNRIVENHFILHRGACIQVCMPSGKIQPRMVSIFLKNEKVILRLATKHLRGAFSTYEEYGILDALEYSRDEGEYNDENSFFCMVLCTTRGMTHLLFEDKNKWKLWDSTIRDLLSSFHSKHNY
ncbi:hypothetical protein LUZ60_014336 [Juncus effusus]|nr:hypothetical protein LUZ60_014336 [Juncus effusus]